MLPLLALSLLPFVMIFVVRVRQEELPQQSAEAEAQSLTLLGVAWGVRVVALSMEEGGGLTLNRF